MGSEQHDEIVAEVRRARQAFFKKCGGTLEGLVAKLKELEKAETRPFVSYPPRKLVAAPTDSAK